MSKLPFVYLLVFCSIKFLNADEPVSVNLLEEFQEDVNEIQVVDDLIALTEAQLVVQKQVKELMIEFKKHRDLFEKGDQTKNQAYLMVKMASQLLGVIKDNHLQQIFSLPYMEELTFFSSIAGKNAPIRP